MNKNNIVKRNSFFVLAILIIVLILTVLLALSIETIQLPIMIQEQDGYPTYNEAVMRDLDRYRQDMLDSEDSTQDYIIAQMVIDRFANYDESMITDIELRAFLEDCRNMNIQRY